MNTSPIGAHLRDTRLKRGLSLREVARRAELSPGFLSKIENGESRPTETAIRRIAAVLATDADSLLAVAECIPLDALNALRFQPKLVTLIRRARSLTDAQLDATLTTLAI